MNPTHPQEVKTYAGGCHCGKVRIEAELGLSLVSRCNCSICTKLSWTGSRAQPTGFRLVSGEDALSEYRIPGGMYQRYFCSACGVHVFARGDLPELGGQYVAVNVNCLDDVEPLDLRVQYWDGRHNNWHAGSRPEPWSMRP